MEKYQEQLAQILAVVAVFVLSVLYGETSGDWIALILAFLIGTIIE